MQINELAKRCGLSAHTLRYYEKIGLIKSIRRNDSGHRSYSEHDFGWICFIKKLKITGMPLSMIKTFAELRHQGEHTALQRLALLQQHYQSTTQKINLIQSNLNALENKMHFYQGLIKKTNLDLDLE